MCGGGNPLRGVLRGGFRLLDTATFGVGSSIVDPLGIRNVIDPQMPPTPEAIDPTLSMTQPESVDQAQLEANQRERRRAARRFGRASTIGAGTVGAPTGGGKTAIGA